MKVKKKDWKKIVDLAMLYEEALEDIAYNGIPEEQNPIKYAKEILQKGYNYEFGD